jgi:hypothetical protein
MPLFSCTGDSSWAAHIHKITFGFQQRGVTLQDNGISHFDLTGRSKKEPGHPPWPRFDLALGRRLFQPFAVCLGCTGLSIKRKKRNLGSLMMCFQFLPRQYVSNMFPIWVHGCFVWLHKTMSGMTVSAAILHGHKIKSSRSFPGRATEWMSTYFVIFHDVSTYWCLVGNGWEMGEWDDYW